MAPYILINIDYGSVLGSHGNMSLPPEIITGVLPISPVVSTTRSTQDISPLNKLGNYLVKITATYLKSL